MKKIEKQKSSTEVTDDEWSGTLEMLLGLDGDPCSYVDITDNPWSFKIRNKGKRERVHSILDV
jgi:hypothetical protein